MPSSILAVAAPLVLFVTCWALCFWPLAGFARVLKAGARHGAAWALRSRAGTWADRHAGPVGPYASILLVMAVGGVAAIGAGYLFVELAEQVGLASSAVNHADQAIQTWFGQERQSALTALLRAATAVGGTVGTGAMVTVAAAVLFVRRERASAIFVVVTVVAGTFLSLGLKMIFARARPDLVSALTSARWYSFPSGHAMGSFVAFGALAYLALRQPWGWAARSAGLALASTMVVLVGVSRVYLGVHWASDIAGAWAAGTVWLVSAVVAFEMLLRLRQWSREAASRPATGVPDRPAPVPPAVGRRTERRDAR